MDKATINTLLIETAKANRQAFHQLYQQTSPKLFAMCLKLTHNDHSLAEDILQDAYLKIWMKAKQFDQDKGNALTWMSRVTINLFYDRMRSKRSKPAIVDTEIEYEDLQYSSKEPSLPETIDQKQLIDKFHTALEKLPEKQRVCIEMFVKFGFTHEEVSRQTQVPLGTVKAWIRRTLKDFRLHHQLNLT